MSKSNRNDIHDHVPSRQIETHIGVTMSTASSKTHELSFQQAALSSIKPYERNPRHHSRRQIQRIAKSITAFGFTNPIAVDEDGVILAGHGRYFAAQSLGLSEVPIVRIAGLSTAEKVALRVGDNRLAETSTWDLDFLPDELRIVLKADFPAEITGFDAIDFDRILTPIAAATADEDPAPAPPDWPISRLGDHWRLGVHEVICGDARDPKTIQALLWSRPADLVFTDPPYNVRIPGNVSGQGSVKHDDFQMASGEMTGREFIDFLTLTLGNARDASKNGSLHYVCMDWRGFGKLLTLGESLYATLMNVCVWAKPNGGMGSFYRSQHEFIAVFKHGDGQHINNVQLGRLGRYRSNVWQYPGATTFSKTRKSDLADHPTVKPVAMVADAIRDASKPGDLVLDPFGGSGTTLLAAELTGRRACLIEIDPKYVDVILTRFQKQSGLEPRLLPCNTPLSLVKQMRLASKEGHNDKR